DRILSDGDRVTLGNTTLTAHITAGHTKGCTTWTMRTAGKNVVFVGSPSVPSDYKLNHNLRYPEVIRDYRKQFATLKSLGCDVFLASHGNFFELADMVAGKKKYAGCDEYHAFVEAMERRFEERVAKGE
ncbi:MAG TPA: subclass B3 metallo-beta-lactamase, partial [Thermoanaerobaculia bacterium]